MKNKPPRSLRNVAICPSCGAVLRRGHGRSHKAFECLECGYEWSAPPMRPYTLLEIMDGAEGPLCDDVNIEAYTRSLLKVLESAGLTKALEGAGDAREG